MTVSSECFAPGIGGGFSSDCDGSVYGDTRKRGVSPGSKSLAVARESGQRSMLK